MDKQFGSTASRWTSLAAFLLILLFAGAADGIMEAIGPPGFLLASTVVIGATWVLAEIGGA